ncbi:hypothetical protein BY996DRAFT_4578848 [Phakopsora pachyrhizi]|nr:hypothetical protein BY996DRAFT_4578848 [Phakopsora pachyrhizi]
MSLPQELQGITGPFIVGTSASTFLFGITLTQCYTYFSNFKKDRASYQIALVILLVVDVSHTIFCQITLWLWFVMHYGEKGSVSESPWSFAVGPILCGIAAFVVQIFYAHRIYLLGQRTLVIPCIIIFGSLFQLAWSIGATAKIFEIKFFSEFQLWTYGVACWLGGAAATDLIITTTLIFLLSRSKSNLRHTNNAIDRLITLTIETNGLTFTVALLDLILFACISNGAHVGPNLCLIKLYFNSFLVSLNSRTELSENFGQTRSLRSNIFSSAKNIRHSIAHVACEFPTGHSINSEDHRNHDGVHVCTTATLSAAHVSVQPKTQLIPGQVEFNGIGSMRADTMNGFTTKIIGGFQTEKVRIYFLGL